ncbi:MAG: M1 family metallopeptidase [Puia sp.]|nr:M1 family metallopeptidase [Puia sp.]
MKILVGLLFLWMLHATVQAQDTGWSKTNPGFSRYNPRDLFPALSAMPPGNVYRAATGEPGPSYWQNRAEYTIDAVLDDTAHRITGTMVVTYTNHSPHTLPFIWFQLDQNVFKSHSRGVDAKLFTDSNAFKLKASFEGGYTIHSIERIKDRDKGAPVRPVTWLVDDTRMQIRFAEPLASGAVVRLRIAYSYTIPRYFYNADFGVNRTDILSEPDGDIYSVAQWYPRLCVLDDVEGWNTLPYLGNGEFYLEYGDFNVNITLPSAYIVSASGELLNPGEVLTPAMLKRWRQAHDSERKVFIRGAEEIHDPGSRPSKRFCTWKFRIRNARDFAWTASKSFIWEGIRIDLPDGRNALGESLYPIASRQPGSWERSSEYIKFTIEYFSRNWLPYPYPCAVNVASNLSGMEYPGIVFCGPDRDGNSFWRVTNHELGHTWFPMIVGSNERKYAWMDEGFNIFIDHMASEAFNHGEFEGYGLVDDYLQDYYADSLPPILTRPDGTPANRIFTTQYLKTGYLLWLLREHILGPGRFDYAFRKYIRDWAYKHPTPWDFFRSINNGAGEDLAWFWKEGFFENYKLDQAITGVYADPKDPSGGTLIAIDNLEKAAMPLEVEVTTLEGKKRRYRLPVEIWEYDHRYVLRTGISDPIRKIVLDPDKVYPDIDRTNNAWENGLP